MEASSSDADLNRLLNKKATFESAVQTLQQRVEAASSPAALQELLPLVSRVHVLLKARYSIPGFWAAGLRLIQAVAGHGQASAALDKGSNDKLQAYMADALQFAEPPDEQQPAAREMTLGELYLGLPPPEARQSHLSDAGLVLDHAPRLVQAAIAARTVDAGGADAPEQQQEQQQEQLTEEEALEREQRQRRADMQQSILEGLEAVYSGMESVSRGTEAVQQELEMILAQMAEAAGPSQPSRPPASKRAVAALPKVVLDEAKLQELGGDKACSVCTEDLAVGDKVQLLPCRHSYHPDCLAPWLKDNNSCPVCRHELPTDDPKYEAKKERDAQEAEEQRGAQNATTLEFMYV